MNADVAEKVNRIVCKSILNVKHSSNSFAVYGTLANFSRFLLEDVLDILKTFLKWNQTKK